MKFVSTRGQSPAVDFSTALTTGLAADGGLYMAASLPKFALSDFSACESLPEVAARLLAPFLDGDALALRRSLKNGCHDGEHMQATAARGGCYRSVTLPPKNVSPG